MENQKPDLKLTYEELLARYEKEWSLRTELCDMLYDTRQECNELEDKFKELEAAADELASEATDLERENIRLKEAMKSARQRIERVLPVLQEAFEGASETEKDLVEAEELIEDLSRALVYRVKHSLFIGAPGVSGSEDSPDQTWLTRYQTFWRDYGDTTNFAFDLVKELDAYEDKDETNAE